jgi:hypothetical protein
MMRYLAYPIPHFLLLFAHHRLCMVTSHIYLLPPTSPHEQVVHGYISDLLKRSAYDEAAALSRRLLRQDAALWERFAYLFAQARQLHKLAPYLPTGRYGAQRSQVLIACGPKVQQRQQPQVQTAAVAWDAEGDAVSGGAV